MFCDRREWSIRWNINRTRKGAQTNKFFQEHTIHFVQRHSLRPATYWQSKIQGQIARVKYKKSSKTEKMVFCDFQAPVPISPWTKPIQTTDEYGSPCPRFLAGSYLTRPTSEDCLFLNVFKPGKRNSGIPTRESKRWIYICFRFSFYFLCGTRAAVIKKDEKLAVMLFIYGKYFSNFHEKLSTNQAFFIFMV